ncbi:hypothetical protein [Thioalkalivibrio sp. ALJ16]|uniref:hypothetical protein n=1 Tax=Thioalkalivibrio sp. ALJ16 TaxID=1158762 RepID=UPI000477E089|nr:hypothetical protein [Thioalkalivibrio sp. ALJ16]
MQAPTTCRRRTRHPAAALLLTTILGGCALLPVEGERPSTDPAPESTATQADGAAAEADDAQAGDARTQELQIAHSETAEQERITALLAHGHEPLEADRLGYYMDVLGARLRQELAGLPVAIEHRDRGIRLALSAAASADDQGQALTVIGRLLDEFRASLVTVTALGPAASTTASSQADPKARALAAGHALAQTGIGAERLVLRSRPQPAAAGTSSSEAASQLELLIQPLATS